MREFFAKNKIVIMPHSLYTPDLAGADFFLFLKLKTPIEGKCFAAIEERTEDKRSEAFRGLETSQAQGDYTRERLL